jgi:hypothetical protein
LVDGELVAIARGDALAAEVGGVGEGLRASGRGGLLGEGGQWEREAERKGEWRGWLHGTSFAYDPSFADGGLTQTGPARTARVMSDCTRYSGIARRYISSGGVGVSGWLVSGVVRIAGADGVGMRVLGPRSTVRREASID